MSPPLPVRPSLSVPRNIHGVTKVAAEDLCEHDFAMLLGRLRAGEDLRSPLARLVGAKGYHDRTFSEGPYPAEKLP